METVVQCLLWIWRECVKHVGIQHIHDKMLLVALWEMLEIFGTWPILMMGVFKQKVNFHPFQIWIWPLDNLCLFGDGMAQELFFVGRFLVRPLAPPERVSSVLTSCLVFAILCAFEVCCCFCFTDEFVLVFFTVFMSYFLIVLHFVLWEALYQITALAVARL